MIDIVVYENGSTSLKSIVLGNQYENRDETINFTFPETFNDYYKYMIAVNKTVRPNKVVILPILENKLIISSSLTYDAGNWYMYTMVRQNEVDLSQPNPDMAAQEGEHVFISDGFVGIINRVNFTKEEIESIPLDQNLQIIYDELFELKLQIEELIKDISFDLASLVKEEVDKLRPGIVNEVYNEVIDQVGQGVKGDKGAGFYSSSASPNETFQIDLPLILPQSVTVGDHIVDPNGDVWLVELVDTNVTVNSTKVSSLKGKDGTPGKDGINGVDGTDGVDGKSAYQIAVENGFEGTEKEWLASLDYEHSEEFTLLASQVRGDAQSVSSIKDEIDVIKTSIDTTKSEIDTAKTQVTEKAQEVELDAQHVSEQVSAFDKKVSDANTSIDTKASESITSISQKTSTSIQQIDDKVAMVSSGLDNKVSEAQGYANEAKLAKEGVISTKDEVALKATQVEEAKTHIDNQVSSFDKKVTDAGISIDTKVNEGISSIGTKTQESIQTIETKTSEITNSIDEKVNQASGYANETKTAATQVTQDKQSIETLIAETNEKIEQDKISISESVSAAKTSETNAKASEEETKKQAEAVKVDLTTKLDKNQGEVNKNKTLKINDSGEVVPGDEVYSKSEIDEDFGTVNDLVNELSYSGYKTSNGNEFHGETSDYGIEIESIKGNFYQEKTNGYQLFDASKLPNKTMSGATITNNGDGSFTISGSGNLTSSFSHSYTYTREEALKLIKAGTLYGVAEMVSNPYYIFGIYNKSDGTSVRTVSNNVNKIISATIIEDYISKINDGLYELKIYFYGISGRAITPGTIKPMVYQDGDGTWERFTGGEPAPNPNCPCEPKFFEATEFYSVSKNMFDFDLIKTTGCNNGTKTYNDNSITLKATANDCYDTTYQSSNFRIKVKPNTKYTLLFKRNSTVSGITYIFEFDEDGNTLTPYQAKGGYSLNESVTFTTKPNCSMIAFRVGIATSGQTCTFSDFMILEGGLTWETVDELISHKGQSTTPLDITLRSLPNGVCDTYENDIITRRVGYKMLDGSENWTIDSGNSTTEHLRFIIKGYLLDKIPQHYALCNKFKVRTTEAHGDYEYIYLPNNDVFLMINRSRLETQDVNGLKKYLKLNPITVYYELVKPIQEYITLPTLPSYYPYTNAWHNSPVEATEIKYKAKTYDALLEQEQFIEEDYIKVTETDDMVSTSSNRGGAELLELDGNYYQYTTKGYQLYNASKLATQSAGGSTVTNNGDGSITISGSGQLSAPNVVSSRYYKGEIPLKAGKLTLKLGAVTLPYAYVVLYYSDSTLYKSMICNNVSDMSIDVEESFINSDGWFMTFGVTSATGQIIKPGTIKPMLYQDGDGIFEPFTGGKASPNPNYKQDMIGVDISEIYSRNKNLVNLNDYKLRANGSIVFDEDEISITDEWYNYFCVKVPKYTDIRIKYDLIQKGTRQQPLAVYKLQENGSLSSEPNRLLLANTNSTDVTMNTGNCNYVGILFYCGTGTKATMKIKNLIASISEVSSMYTPYLGSTTPFNQTLRALPNGVKDTYKNGILTRRVGVVTFDGSSDEAWKEYTDVVKETHTFVINLDKPFGVNNAFCNKLVYVQNCWEKNNEFSCSTFSVGAGFYVNTNSEISTVATFKTWLQSNPITVWYELVTPQITTIDKPFIETYHPWTNIWTDSPIKTHMKIGFKNRFGEFYTKKEIDNLLEELKSTLLTSTASILPTSTQAEILEEDYNSLVELIKEE